MNNCVDPKSHNVQIAAEYAIGIWKRNIGGALPPVKGSATSKSIRTRKWNSDEWTDFDEYAPDGYCKLVMDIMDELSISDIRELKTRIDEAIDFCTSEMDVSQKGGDEKRSKYYSNHRSALNKYKQFLQASDIS
jgi:hypothetical protein